MYIGLSVSIYSFALPVFTSLDSPLSFYFDKKPAEFPLSLLSTPFSLSGFIIMHNYRFVKYFLKTFIYIHKLFKNGANFPKSVIICLCYNRDKIIFIVCVVSCYQLKNSTSGWKIPITELLIYNILTFKKYM